MHSKIVIAGVLSLTAFTSATPLSSRQSSDTANDWNGKCADVAIIFARGTFDSGNIGPWVGQPFRDALNAQFGNGKVAFQGVNPQDYAADLNGYVEDGGPEGCALSLAQAVQKYTARCPSAKIVISGWSQGALCAHKSLGSAKTLTASSARNQVIALVTFGDPISLWQDTIAFPSIPSDMKALSYCELNTPDPLCTSPGENFPSDPAKLIEKLKADWTDFSQTRLNDAQKAAVPNLIGDLTKQAKSKIGKLGEDILAGHIRRWLLTPQHFSYGLGPNAMVNRAANDIFKLYQSSR